MKRKDCWAGWSIFIVWEVITKVSSKFRILSSCSGSFLSLVLFGEGNSTWDDEPLFLVHRAVAGGMKGVRGLFFVYDFSNKQPAFLGWSGLPFERGTLIGDCIFGRELVPTTFFFGFPDTFFIAKYRWMV